MMITNSMRLPARSAITLCLLITAACNPVPPTPATPQSHSPRFGELELVHTVYFDTDDADLQPAEAEALRQFAARIDEQITLDNIVVGHADVRASDAHNDALSARRATAVADLLVAEGVPAEQITRHALGRRQPVTAADQETAWRLSRRVEVLARGIVVVEPNCPDWSRPSATHPANLPTSNFGCATSLNLVRMVADPRDLVRGVPLGPNDPTRTVDAVSRYRADDVEPLTVETSSR
jgi:pilus biogenesis lipoprotein CpaD